METDAELFFAFGWVVCNMYHWRNALFIIGTEIGSSRFIEEQRIKLTEKFLCNELSGPLDATLGNRPTCQKAGYVPGFQNHDKVYYTVKPCNFHLDEQSFIHCYFLFDAWTASTLHFTEIRTLHSILSRRISPVTTSDFKLNLVYFQLNSRDH